MLRGAFPDLHAEIHDQLVDGDKVVTRKTFHGTHKGEFMGIAPTGREVAFDVIDIVRVRDGFMVEHWNVVVRDGAHDATRAHSDAAGWSGPGWIRTNVAVTQRVYSPSPLASRVPTRRYVSSALFAPSLEELPPCRRSTLSPKSTTKRFATRSIRPHREVATRFDFKGTDSSVELKDTTIDLASASEDRLKALVQVLEEKLVKRKVSLKLLSYGKVEEATKGSVRQTATLNVGISADKAREIGKFIKGLGLKGVQHQVQGEQLRVTGKKRDDLQSAIAALREHDFEVPLQFNNFRD